MIWRQVFKRCLVAFREDLLLALFLPPSGAAKTSARLCNDCSITLPYWNSFREAGNLWGRVSPHIFMSKRTWGRSSRKADACKELRLYYLGAQPLWQSIWSSIGRSVVVLRSWLEPVCSSTRCLLGQVCLVPGCVLYIDLQNISTTYGLEGFESDLRFL